MVDLLFPRIPLQIHKRKFQHDKICLEDYSDDELGGNHHTLRHRPTARIAREISSGSSQRDNASQSGNDGTSVTTEQQVPSGSRDVTGAGNGNVITVAATGAVETRVCLGIVPIKVGGKGNNQIVETYALLDNGSEVTLCHEQ